MAKEKKESVAFKAGPWWDSKCSESSLCWEIEMHFKARPESGYKEEQTYVHFVRRKMWMERQKEKKGKKPG